MAVQPTNDLEAEAVHIGDALSVKFFGTHGAPNVGQISLLSAAIFGQLYKRHPKVGISTLHSAAEYGAYTVAQNVGAAVQDTSPIAAVIDTTTGEVGAVTDAGASIVGELAKLTDVTTWVRGGYMIAGAVLIFYGIFIVAKELGATGVPKLKGVV